MVRDILYSYITTNYYTIMGNCFRYGCLDYESEGDNNSYPPSIVYPPSIDLSLVREVAMAERDASVDPTITTEFDERISPPPIRPHLLMSNPEMISREQNANFDSRYGIPTAISTNVQEGRRERKKVISLIIPMPPMAIWNSQRLWGAGKRQQLGALAQTPIICAPLCDQIKSDIEHATHFGKRRV